MLKNSTLPLKLFKYISIISSAILMISLLVSKIVKTMHFSAFRFQLLKMANQFLKYNAYNFEKVLLI